MKNSLNIIKCIVGICLLLTAPLSTYAASSSNERHSCKKHPKSCKQGKHGTQSKQSERGSRDKRGKQDSASRRDRTISKPCTCINECRIKIKQDSDLNQDLEEDFSQENPLTVTTPISR